MKKRRPRIAPEVRYNAVIDLIRNKDTLKQVARRNNMSISALWNYYADVDAAIKKVVGMDNSNPSQHAAQSRASQEEKACHKGIVTEVDSIPQEESNEGELVIRIKIQTS
jgi:transposase-like protein